MFDGTKLVECPTLTPTMEEFNDPIGYLSRPDIQNLGLKYGIVKLVPPSDWTPLFLLSSEFRFHTRKQKISDLGITTRSRKYFVGNLNRYLKMRKKKQLDLSLKYADKDIYYYDLFVQVEKHGLSAEGWKKINVHFGVDEDSPYLRREYYVHVKSYAEYLKSNLSDQLPQSDSEDDEANCLICGKHNSPTQTLLCDNCDNPFHLKCLGLDDIPPGNWYCKKCLVGTGEYGFEEEIDNKFSLQDFLNHCNEFTRDFVLKNGRLTLDDIERIFWNYVDGQREDIEVRYGADIHNLVEGEISGFPMHDSPEYLKRVFNKEEFDSYASHPFNLTNLPYSKGSLLNYINHSISGMTVPWIYVGSMFSTFCWHVEDHYTLSANYCHFGSTKKWYGIPATDSAKFEKLMRDTAPDLFKRQPDLLHQLVTLMSPMKLLENGIQCYYANQNPNEFVITYPKVYHAGFNSGFNFNEAVNFTMDMWLEYGESCIDDYKLIKKENVFNHYKLMENVLIHYIEGKERNINLVKRCLASYKRFISNVSQLLSDIDEDDYIVEENDKKIDFKYYLESDKDTEDEEELCDVCKTHISHIYCIINNKKHTFNNQLMFMVEEAAQKKPPSKMSITQLLTPESSPQEEVTEKFKVEKERTLMASDALSEMTNKRTRRSHRIEKSTHQHQEFKSKMSMIKHKDNINELNNKKHIKLCLQCNNKLKEVPAKSKLIINVNVEEMNRFIHQIEAKLV